MVFCYWNLEIEGIICQNGRYEETKIVTRSISKCKIYQASFNWKYYKLARVVSHLFYNFLRLAALRSNVPAVPRQSLLSRRAVWNTAFRALLEFSAAKSWISVCWVRILISSACYVNISIYFIRTEACGFRNGERFFVQAVKKKQRLSLLQP